MADPKDTLKGPEPIIIPKRSADDDFDKLGTTTKGPITLRPPDDDFVPLGRTPSNSGNQPYSLGIPKGPQQPLTNDAIGQVMNVIRPFVSATAGSLAGTLGGGVPGGIAAYTGVDLAQKYTNPSYVPENNVEAFTTSAKEGILNELVPRVLLGSFGILRNVRNAGVPDPLSVLNLNPTTAQALENLGYTRLAKAATFMENYGAPASKVAAMDRAGGKGFTQSLYLYDLMQGNRTLNMSTENIASLRQKLLTEIEGGINKSAVKGQFQGPLHYASKDSYDLLTNGSNPFDALDNVLQNKKNLDKVLSVGQLAGPGGSNVRKTLQQYYWDRIFTEATETIPGGGARIDPKKIDDLWFNPKNPELGQNLETLYGAQGKQNLDKFMKNVIDVQSGAPSTGVMSRLQYLGKGFGISGLLTPVIGAGPAGVVGSALYLTNATMGKLLTNPNVGKDVIAALTGTGASLGNKVLARGIFAALEGSRVAIMDQNMKKKWGTITRQPDSSYQLTPE